MKLRSMTSFGKALSCRSDPLNQRTTQFTSRWGGLICCGSLSQPRFHFMIGVCQLRMPKYFIFHCLFGQNILTFVWFKSKQFFLNCGLGTTGREQINLREHDQGESIEADFRRAAEKEVMIPHMLDLYMGKLATVTTQLVDDDGVRDMVYNYGVVLKSIQSGYERRIGSESRSAPGQFQSSLSQLSHPEVRSMDIQGLMTPAISTNNLELEIGDSHSSSTGQLDFQFDMAEPGFDDMVWDTMMNDFSFLKPQNGPYL